MKRTLLPICLLLIANITHAAGWEYKKETDAMTSKSVITARTVSSNSLQLGWPYAGNNYGTLFVRQHPKYGLDVVLTVDKGQLLCSYGGCNVSVRFDDEAPITYRASEPADHDSKALFINGSKSFVARAVKAKMIRVQALMYQEGNQVLVFQVAQPLVWPPKN